MGHKTVKISINGVCHIVKIYRNFVNKNPIGHLRIFQVDKNTSRKYRFTGFVGN